VSASVLVAYATKSGSTKEVAEAVGAALGEVGYRVDLQRLPVSGGLEGYQAVVLGAPLYMFRWHKDALHFLKRYRETLPGLPVAIFALGPFNDVEKEWVEVRAQLDKALDKFPWFAPVAVTVFGGKFDPNTLGFPYTLLPAMKKIPASDIRDWDKIRAWAQEVGNLFRRPDR
jgi:menaquinone-dependent protoporphyrinogen oxidase